MALFNRILCPVDLSDQSRHALDYAAALGRHFGASLTALHVIPPVVPPITSIDLPAYPAYVYTPEDLEAIEHHVRSFVQPERADSAIDTQVAQGYVVGTILDIATEGASDLIVMGTHGRGGFLRLFLGSVAERVLAQAGCAVIAVPPRAPDAVPFGASMFEHILCAVDYTPSSLLALDRAKQLAGESGATLTLVNVVEASSSEPALAKGFEGPGHDSLLVTAARARLHEALSTGAAAGDGTRALVLTGKPYQAILQLAREQGADLIVLGAHGGLANLLGIGSTTNHILREAHCPVLCIRA
jgi:universal stress protein E